MGERPDCWVSTVPMGLPSNGRLNRICACKLGSDWRVRCTERRWQQGIACRVSKDVAAIVGLGVALVLCWLVVYVVC